MCVGKGRPATINEARVGTLEEDGKSLKEVSDNI
jgi:hypothetical protein